MDKMIIKSTCNINCTVKKKAEEDFKSLFNLSSEILFILHEFSKKQDQEIKQIVEYSETSFSESPKL